MIIPLLGLLAWQNAAGTPTALDSAAAGFTRSARQAEQRGDRRGRVEALTGLARVLARMAPADSALAIFDRAERLLQPGEPALESRLRCSRGPLRVTAGKPDSETDAERGLALARATGDEGLISRCWLALGIHRFFHVDDPAVSGPPFDSAEAHARRAGDDAALADALTWSAYDRFSFFDHQAALAEVTPALEAARRSDHREAEAFALRLRGTIAWRTGAFMTSHRELVKAREIARGLGDLSELLQINRMLGNVAFGRGRIDEAETAFRDVLPIAERLGDVVAQITVRHGLAWVSAARGDWPRALEQYHEIIGFMRRNRLDGLIPGFRYSGAVMALRNGDLDHAEAELRWYLSSSSETEYGGRYQARSRLAEIQLRRGRVDAAVAELERASDHLDSLRRTLDNDQLRQLAFQTGGGKYEEPDYGFATLTAMLVREGRADAAFQLAERRRARELADRLLRVASGQPHGRPDSLRLRSPDDSTAVVEFVAGRWGQPTSVLVLTSAGVWGYVAPSLDSLGPRIDRLLGLIQEGAETVALGHRLRKDLLDQVLSVMPPSTTRLVLVPDEQLYRLPFDLLPLTDGRPLIARYAVTLAPSVAVAATLAARDRRADAGAMLVLGNPRSSGTPGDTAGAPFRAAFAEAGGLEPLPHAAAEARAVARYSGAVTVRIGAAATEQGLKSEPLTRFSILHLATHALVDDQSGDHTALVLSPGQGDDGFLTPGEILQLELGADLIVLSACRTAAGPLVSGEGVQGLTSPLFAAGAHAVLATHWPIRDRAALRLVERFYRELAAGSPVDRALQQAKLDAIKRGVPARDWAAFTLVGDRGVTVLLKEPRNRWPLYAVLLALALGGAGVGLHRRRAKLRV